MTNDLISTMLTHIRNASVIKHNYTECPFSKVNISILRILKKEGYINNYEVKNLKNLLEKKIKINLKYTGWWTKRPTFYILKRVSTPGRRFFSSYKDFQQGIDFLKYDQGIAIISTSMGVMSHLRALKLKIGGEILLYIE
jgi:small subunit ribosomal protein S8